MTDANIKLDLALNYGPEAEQFRSVDAQTKFLKTIFTNAVSSAFKSGLGKEYLRRFRDITKKLEEAKVVGESAEPDKLEVSLTLHEFKFLTEAFDKATWTPGSHVLICQVYERLEAAAAKK